jgi:hypothetical protein
MARSPRRPGSGGPVAAIPEAPAEVFNLFNHEHYGNYVTNASNANFGQPAFSPSVQYFPRMLQFGVRATF